MPRLLRLPLSPTLRFRVPLFVLLASIGLTTIAVVDAQRFARSQQQVTQRALREYATFAAWSYGQHLNEVVTTMLRESLGAVNHGDNLHTAERVPRARDLAHYLPYDPICNCHKPRAGPNPETFFAFRVGDNVLDVGLNSHPHPLEGWEVDRPMPVPLAHGFSGPYTRNEEHWILDSLTRRIRGASAIDHGYTMVVGEVDGAPRVIAYTLMPTSWGDTMVYGARYSYTGLTRMLGAVLDGNGLLPATFTQGRRNRDVLAVRVHDSNGHTLFDSAPGVSSPLDAHLALSPRAAQLSIEAVIRPEVAGSLIIGGAPRSRVPFLAGLLVLAAVLAVLAVLQLRREQELTRLRADFISSVSHELRTPLAQIRLFSETLRLGRARTEEQRDWSLRHIDRETTRLTHLVDNVLRFSAMGRGRDAMPQPVDAAGEVLRVADEFRPLAEARNVIVAVDVLASPTVTLRADTLRHILINLLDNAVKYGPTGQTVRVTLDRRGGDLLLTVDDEGPGVPAREREEIWRAFTRGGASVAKGGSGIGLSIVREMTEQHGGRCWVEAAPSGQGARFVVELPGATEPHPHTSADDASTSVLADARARTN